MKVSDYIVEFFIKKGINDVFGYPGGMVTHLMDSLFRYKNEIRTHTCYHEQAAAFEACAYAQVSNSVGVAYATSGPGATNLITGICNAYFDSIPVIFITGQVNTSESKEKYKIRQRGFQETDIVQMVQEVTKYAVYVDDVKKVEYYLDKAYQIALSGRRGPVLLDIPMDIQRGDIELNDNETFVRDSEKRIKGNYSFISDNLINASRPCIILGAALKNIDKELINSFVKHMNIPVVTSMIAMDLLTHEDILNYGFIGAYGGRVGNFIVAKSDCILSLGSRLDVRQTGGNRENFAPNAKIIRVDIDKYELEYKVHQDEIDIQADASEVIEFLLDSYKSSEDRHASWRRVGREIFEKLNDMDEMNGNRIIKNISRFIPSDAVITTDVGQNQVWVAQSFSVKDGQKILFSGGHGTMGYSLPAAIGAFYASQRPVFSFNGDGGFQMNLQELEYIARERIPIKLFVFNNYALGMIRHFQEMYFEGNYTQTLCGTGYDAPDFKKIADAYGIEYKSVENIEDIPENIIKSGEPALIEIILRENTYVYPKLEFGKPNQDQEPLLNRKLYDDLMAL